MVQITTVPTLAPPPSPDMLALRQAYAKQLLAPSQEPIHSWSQGVSGIVDALVGGLMERKAGEQQSQGQASAASQYADLLTGLMGQPATGSQPAAGTPQPAFDMGPAKSFLANPYADAASKQQIVELLLKRNAPPPAPEYGFMDVGGHVVRTNKQGGTAEEILAVPDTISSEAEAQKARIAAAGASRQSVNVGANEMDKLFAKRYQDITDAGNAAEDAKAIFSRMEDLTKDPNFYSGAGGSQVLWLKQGIAALGGDPNKAASMEEFASLSNKSAIASMGGSLGTGFSNADRDYVNTTVPNLDTTIQGNRTRVEVQKRIQERKIELAQMADTYVLEHGNLDAGFNKLAHDYAEAHPLFADLPKAGASAGPVPPTAAPAIASPAAPAASQPPPGWSAAEWGALTPDEKAQLAAKKTAAPVVSARPLEPPPGTAFPIPNPLPLPPGQKPPPAPTGDPFLDSPMRVRR